MKWIKIVGVVVFMHLFALGALMVNPGCKVLPEKDPTLPTHQQTQEKPAAPHQSGSDTFELESGELLLRSEPTRPIKRFRIEEESEVQTIVQESAVPNEIAFEAETTSFNASFDNPNLGSLIYKVEPGDNLSSIAKAYGISLASLLAANNLSMDSILRIGQEVVVPNPQFASEPSIPEQPEQLELASSIDLSGPTISYVVRPGDTLSEIAQRYRTTVLAIKDTNGMTEDAIRIGQTLKIPQASEVNTLHSDQPELPPGAYHVVAARETLSGIAKKYEVSVAELMSLNNITDPRKLRAGKRLLITLENSLEAPSSASESSFSQPTETEPSLQLSSPNTKEEEDAFIPIDIIPIVPIESVEQEG